MSRLVHPRRSRSFSANKTGLAYNHITAFSVLHEGKAYAAIWPSRGARTGQGGGLRIAREVRVMPDLRALENDFNPRWFIFHRGNATLTEKHSSLGYCLLLRGYLGTISGRFQAREGKLAGGREEQAGIARGTGRVTRVRPQRGTKCNAQLAGHRKRSRLFVRGNWDLRKGKNESLEQLGGWKGN